MTGLRCPACGSDALDVKDTRPAEYGVRRRRRCACGHRCTTVEVMAPGKAEDRTVVRLVVGAYGGAHTVVDYERGLSNSEREAVLARILVSARAALGLNNPDPFTEAVARLYERAPAVRQ